MSFFDPQHVYRKGTYYTRKGQVIQKKPMNRHGPLSVRDRDTAVNVVRAFGYSVLPPGDPQTINTIYQNSLSKPFVFRNASVNDDNYTLTFNQLFQNVGTAFDELLVYSEKVTEFKLELLINSICLNTDADAHHTYTLTTSKIQRTYNFNEGIYSASIPYSLSQFRSYVFNSGYGTFFNDLYASSDQLNVLGYHALDSIESYNQLCSNHAITSDFPVIGVEVTNGLLSFLQLDYSIYFTVKYKDTAEPVD